MIGSTNPLHAVLKFCTASAPALSEFQLRAVYDCVRSNSAFAAATSFDDFSNIYVSKFFEDATQMDVLSLPGNLKLKLYKVLNTESSDVRIKNPVDVSRQVRKSSEQSREPLVLPELPEEAVDTLNRQREAKIKESEKAFSLRSRLGGLSADFVKKIMSLKSEVQSLEQKKSALLRDARAVETSSAHSSQSNQALAFEEISAGKDVASPPPTKSVQVDDPDPYGELLSNRTQQLQEVRSQLHDERKRLHQIRLVIANTISSIQDPKLLSVIKELDNKAEQLSARESMLLEQQDVVQTGILHAEQRISFLQREEKNLRNILLQLDQERHAGEKQVAQVQSKVLEQENALESAQRRLSQITKQINEAQTLYDQLNTQASRISEEIRMSRDELIAWEKELDARESSLNDRERGLGQQFTKERDAFHKRMKEMDVEYKKRLKTLQSKDADIERQRRDMLSMKEEMIEIRKSLHNERLELESQEKQANGKFLDLEARERELLVKEKNLNESTQKSLDYIDQQKKELHRNVLLREAEIEKRLIDIQNREMELFRKTQSIAQKEHRRMQEIGSSTKGMTFKKQERILRENAKYLENKIGELKDADDLSDFFDTDAVSKNKDVMPSSPSRDVAALSADVATTGRRNSFSLMNPSGSSQQTSRSESFQSVTGVSVPVPVPDMDGVPSRDGQSSRALLLPDDPDEGKVSLQEIEALLELAKEELNKDINLARVTYNQIRKIYHKMTVDQKKILFPKLMTLYDDIQSRGAVSL